MFSRESFRTCFAGREKAEPLLLARIPFRRRPPERRLHSFQRFLTVADPRLCDSPVRPRRARLCRCKRPFGRLLDLNEVAPFALTALDTQIVGASADAV